MQPVSLFELASHQARWLSVRQAAVAGNVANINTPGYRAVDVQPFQDLLADRTLTVASTQPGHIAFGGASGDFGLAVDDSPVVSTSGNSVSVEEELVKAGEVRRGVELNTAVVKAFHRMVMLASR
ncbi:flagellar basal body rod protein FlgB [Aquibium sp. ELW1220]|uniref:flagellar basal body rod protein FlgB n=1 Tax=Aquibium sp. ELW1220 TaxID=2976766 RepID=UPI0025AF4B0F|nr:flagellar basal body rod protein FlgB [Aquibium sp. ELW1220]MDN2580774.1 flagellar basal body rod protein FlgB [Aquibium sp. ELW1220]